MQGTSLCHSGMLVAAVFLYILTSKNAEAVQCYVCSWSPENGDTDILDVCSTGNFDPLRVSTLDCDRGCKIVKYKDANDDLEMFFRNCVHENEISHKVVKRHGEEIYTCDSKLCNGGTGTIHPTVSLSAVLVAWWIYVHFLSPR